MLSEKDAQTVWKVLTKWGDPKPENTLYVLYRWMVHEAKTSPELAFPNHSTQWTPFGIHCLRLLPSPFKYHLTFLATLCSMSDSEFKGLLQGEIEEELE